MPDIRQLVSMYLKSWKERKWYGEKFYSEKQRKDDTNKGGNLGEDWFNVRARLNKAVVPIDDLFIRERLLPANLSLSLDDLSEQLIRSLSYKNEEICHL
uniref:Uncharacterized protein n=1 Tax=Setaria digitata TaxID=48799 RepID=A0A915Q7H5_9BILA